MTITERRLDERRRFAVPIAMAMAIANGFAGGPACAMDPAARAEALFQGARDLMGRGDYAKACPMLEESYSLDHGAGTLLALALCHEGSGKPATALREYRESLSGAVRANRADRVMLAESGVQRLEAVVPRIALKPPSPEPPGFVLTVDGAPIDRAAIAAGAPVDPGPHFVGASARDAVPWRTNVDVGATSAPVVVQVPALASTRPAADLDNHAPLVPARTRTPAWIAGGVGVAAIAVGAVFGGMAFDAESRSRGECQDLSCSPSGVDLNHQAKRDAVVSDVAFAVGGVALAVSLYLSSPSSDEPSRVDHRAGCDPPCARRRWHGRRGVVVA